MLNFNLSSFFNLSKMHRNSTFIVIIQLNTNEKKSNHFTLRFYFNHWTDLHGSLEQQKRGFERIKSRK